MMEDGILSVAQRDLLAFMLMFWHALLFEVPRFLLAAVSVGAVASRRASRPRLSAPQAVRVSVLMPGHNEAAALRQTVLGLREQTLLPVQIVVVDDGSTDDMAAVARRLRAEGLIDIFISTGLRGGKSAAANLGLSYCTGDIVMIADIDTSFDRDAVERIVEPFLDPAVGGVCGNIAVRNHRASIVAKFQAIQYLMSISLGRRISDMLGVVFIASGAFAAFRRQALTSIGGWEVGPGEDADITIKLRQAGWKVRFQGDAWALTDVPETSLALFRQRLRWNRSLIRVRVRKFGQMFNPARPNFSLLNALGTLDIILFQAILPVSFFIYIFWLFSVYGAEALIILAVVSFVYICGAIVSFLVAASVAGHYGRLSLLPYVVGYALYNAFLLRAVSVYAYLDELILRRSYRDPYVPTRVLQRVEKF